MSACLPVRQILSLSYAFHFDHLPAFGQERFKIVERFEEQRSTYEVGCQERYKAQNGDYWEDVRQAMAFKLYYSILRSIYSSSLLVPKRCTDLVSNNEETNMEVSTDPAVENIITI